MPRQQNLSFFVVVCAQSHCDSVFDEIKFHFYFHSHYSDVIICTMAYKITGVSAVCKTVCSGADKKQHHSAVSLAVVRWNRRWPITTVASSAEIFSISWRHHADPHRFILQLQHGRREEARCSGRRLGHISGRDSWRSCSKVRLSYCRWASTAWGKITYRQTIFCLWAHWKLKTENCDVGTLGCRCDNLLCHHWRQSWHHDSVFSAEKRFSKQYIHLMFAVPEAGV